MGNDQSEMGNVSGVTPMTRASRLVLAVLFAGFAAACASGASVGQLKTNPGRYVDKNVTVHGTVTQSWGIPLVPFKMYQVDDGTGEILVVADHDRVPSRGARVKVTGKVSEFAVIGGRSIGLHLRANDLDYDGR
jgi:high-affinity K+ transport system ATPase subunit B